MELHGDARRQLLLLAMIVLTGIALGLGSVSSAPLALGAAAGALFLVVAYRDPALGLCLFVVITFFDRSSGLQSGGVTIVKLAGASLALLWLVEAGSGRRTPMLFRDQPTVALIAFFLVVWTLASGLWASDPQEALTGSSGSAFRLAQGVLLLFITYSALRQRKHVWWFVWAFIAGSVFAAGIGLFGAYAPTASVNDARLSGGFDDPNELAAVLVPAIVLSAAAFLAVGRRTIRWLYAAVAALLGYAFFQTDSQAGLLALGVALILAVVFSGRARARTVAVVGALVLCLGAYYTFVTKPVAIETIASQDNVSGRESLWSVAAQMAKDHPIFGVGAGNFVVAEPAYAASDLNLPRADLVVKPELVHNSYLQVLAELGIVGLIAFLGVIGASLALGVRAARAFERAGDWELEMLSRGVVIGTVAILVAYFFASNQYEKQLWILVAAGPALFSVSQRAATRSSPGTPHAGK